MAVSLETTAAVPDAEELRALHGRLSQRLRTPSKPAEFFASFAAESQAALKGTAVAVWLVDGDRLPCVATTQPAPDDLNRLERSAREVVAVGAGTTIKGELAGRGPALLYPLRLGTSTCGVVLLVLPTDAGRTEQAVAQRALVPLCDYAAEYIYRFERAAAAAAGSHSAVTGGGLAADSPQRFARDVHASLDATQTATVVANETRRLIGCDRVSVCYIRGSRAEAAAFSGQDRFDRRSQLVRLLEDLSAAVAHSGRPLQVPHGNEPLASPVERALQAYVDETQARQLAVWPIHDGADDGGSNDAATSDEPNGEVVAVVVLEQIAAQTGNADRLDRFELLRPHATQALINARRYSSQPFGGLSRLASSIVGAFARRNLPKTLVVAGLCAAAVGALWLIPYPFAVEARGTLQPVVRRDVFAAVDGTVEKVLVHTGDRVGPGDLMFELRNNELDVAEADLIKQMNENEQELLNAQRAYNEGNRTLTTTEQNRLLGQIAVYEQRRESLRRQGTLFTEKRGQLQVRSPMAGQVATWNVGELLTQRPVRRGQALVGLVDPDGQWEVEIRVPEDRFGHVATAARDRKEPLTVTFVSAADPNQQCHGTVRDIHLAAEPRGEEGNVVLIKASFDKEQVSNLQTGADVRVRIECGNASLGYVLLGDVWSFFQTRVWFRL